MDDFTARRILQTHRPGIALTAAEIALLRRKGSDKLAQFNDAEHAALIGVEERAHHAGVIYSSRVEHASGPGMIPEGSEVFDKPLPWQRDGLHETASGYGAKLTSRRCVRLPDGKVRRVYMTIYGNAGSAWITYQGRKLYLRDTD
jgi:hypothetical protein